MTIYPSFVFTAIKQYASTTLDHRLHGNERSRVWFKMSHVEDADPSFVNLYNLKLTIMDNIGVNYDNAALV